MSTVDLPTLSLDPDLDQWDRHPAGETVYRYSQFRVYLDQGRGRTLRKVAETLTRNTAYVRAVSAAYRWVERAEAWDRYRDDLHEKAWLEERRKAAENDAKLLGAVVGKVAQRLQTLQPEDLEPADLIRLLDVAMRHRRGLFGDPTTTVAVTGAGGDPLTVQLAELAQMDTAQRRAAILQLTDAVRRRSEAAAGGTDDD
jgi:hypothetical protein